jgi:coproporphyrinogen III oxidase
MDRLELRRELSDYTRNLQDRITTTLAAIDGTPFREDTWTRPEGGGGRTRILAEGRVFEKAGVNVSEVWGELGEDFARQLPGEGHEFFATGISLVLHPRSPMVPTCHANFRYVEKGTKGWIGGGADLTPYYLWDEDAIHFHRTWKNACDRHDRIYYPRFKKWCDEYFHLPHRGEARGVGGIFFDYLDPDSKNVAFWKDAGAAFLDAYVPIVERRRDEAWGEREREHQLRRRGRYVEFNLVYDRGTVFGLRTKGRVESILMSLPPLVRYDYDVRPEPGSREYELLQVLVNPRDWIPFDGDSI